MKTWNIQPAFKIPRGYRKTFILGCGGMMHRIRVARKHGLRMDCAGPTDSDDGTSMSRSLDWIQETIEGVRWECEQITVETE